MKISRFAQKALKERNRQAEELERTEGIKKESAINLTPNSLEIAALNFIRDETWDKANNNNSSATPNAAEQEADKS